MDTTLVYLIIAIAAGAILLIGGVVVYALISGSREKHREVFAAISRRVGGQIDSSGIGGPRIVGRCREIPYRIYILSGSQYSAPDLRIEFTGGLPFVLTLQAEGLNSRLERLVGFGSGRNIKIGIPEFDERFAVRTTEPEKARAFFQLPEVRKSLDEIAARGGSFLCRGKYAEIIIPLAPPETSLETKPAADYVDTDKVVELLEMGAFLIATLEKTAGDCTENGCGRPGR